MKAFSSKQFIIYKLIFMIFKALPIILSLLTGSTGIYSYASDVKNTIVTSHATVDAFQKPGTVSEKKMTKPFGTFSPLPSRSDTYTVTCRPKFDESTSYCSSAYCFRTDEPTAYDIDYMEGEEVAIQLPEGVYDFWFSFDSFMGGPRKIVIQENVKIDGDTTLSFDSEEANVPVNYQPLLPDGTPMVPDSYDPETGTIIKGNVGPITGYSLMVHKPTGFGVIHFGFGDLLLTEADAPAFVANFVAGAENGTYAGNLFADNMHVGTISNNPDNYRHVKTLFHGSRFVYDPEKDPNPDFFPDVEHLWYGAAQLGWDGKAWVGGSQRKYNVSYNLNDLYICTSFANSRAANDKTEFTFIPVKFEWENLGQEYRIIAPFMKSENGKVSYEVRHNSLLEDNILDRWWNNDEEHASVGWVTAVHPRFSFDYDPDSDPYMFGYNCPITVLSLGHLYDTDFGLGVDFRGRYGERRSIDYMRASIDVRKDGNSMMSNANTAWDQLMMQEPGKYEVEIFNDNTEMRGIPSLNHSVTTFSFDPAAENTFTTLQMVQLRDNADKINDMFDTSDQGTLEFAGGAFKFHATGDWRTGWFDEVPGCEAKVEYAPFMTDSYMPLDVEEVPELHFMPGYGSFFRCSLANVDREARYGAFDLRITLTEPGGTSQVQTISPAFIVNSLRSWAGIETITEDSKAFEYPCQVYTIGGVLLNSSADSTDIEALAPGMYILRSGNLSRRHLVR